jgi:type IV pilus assembly protein PilV
MMRRKRQRGFSLIEVLVSTVVFGIGVLGITSLNAISKRSSYQSVQRSSAAQLSFALLEDMRSNAGALAVYLAAGDLGRGSQGVEPTPLCDDPALPCTAAELATHNLWDWEQLLDGNLERSGGVGVGGLITPAGCIRGPAGGVTGMYTVTVTWLGSVQIASPGPNNCGTGLYGPGNVFRRTVVLRSYIDPSI